MLSKLIARRGHALINAACFSRGNWTGLHALISIGIAFRASHVLLHPRVTLIVSRNTRESRDLRKVAIFISIVIRKE